MMYTPLTMKAMKIAYDAHAGQLDKCGVPYVFHPFHVAERMTSETATIVALLHDVPEDTKVTFEDLEKAGFSKEVIDALRLLKHDKKVPYLDYVENLKHNPIAREVKIGDINHNSEAARVYASNVKIFARLIKYGMALRVLRREEQSLQLGRPGAESEKDLAEDRKDEVRSAAEAIMKDAARIENGVYKTLSGARVSVFDGSFKFEDKETRVTALLEPTASGELKIGLSFSGRNYKFGANSALDAEAACFLMAIGDDIRKLKFDTRGTQRAIVSRINKKAEPPLDMNSMGKRL